MLEGLYLWPDNPALSILAWVPVLVLVLYGARTPAHRAILALARGAYRACRLTARSIVRLADRLAERNREVLLSAGMEGTGRAIEQEFRRISATVDRDLASYPSLHRQLSEQVTQIEEDYRRATDAPPEPGAWLTAMRAAEELAASDRLQDSAAKAVEALHQGLKDAHQKAVREYRSASSERHKLLTRMAPVWRRMDATLKKMDGALRSIFERAHHIDDLMADYREISGKSTRAEQVLGASGMTQFIIAGFVLVIASLGGFINFQLIALPMSEMVGATSRLVGMQTSDVAALVIILVEITMGIFLMECLRITRLFPVIGALDDRLRKRMAMVTFGILLTLAGIEASLAYMRDLLAADRAALTQSLAGGSVERPEFLWIPSLGQMVMGFVLPFALTFVAIPLESFVHASRTVAGQALVALLRLFAFGLRLIGNVTRSVGIGIVHLFDILIFPALKVEEWLLEERRKGGRTKKKTSTSNGPEHGPSAA